jgi:hypothetical protein
LRSAREVSTTAVRNRGSVRLAVWGATIDRRRVIDMRTRVPETPCSTTTPWPLPSLPGDDQIRRTEPSECAAHSVRGPGRRPRLVTTFRATVVSPANELWWSTTSSSLRASWAIREYDWQLPAWNGRE